MALAFADTHNMIAYLTKSDASEGFDQIIDFLNASSIKYALTVNPNIYVSCIKQFWTSVSVKKVNDVTRLQALVDKKKVIITKATIKDAFRLDDAESIDCLPNEEIFIYAKRTSWNEFSSSMASAVICLSSEHKLVISSHSTKYSSPSLTQKVFAKMKRVRKGFSGVDTSLFEGMLVAQQVDESVAKINVDDVHVADEGAADVNVDAVFTAVAEPSIPSPTPPTQPPPPSQDLPSTLQDAEMSIDLLYTLLETYTTLTRRVKHLEHDKIAQALEITKLKQRIKKLGRRNKLKVSKLRRLKKVGTSQRVDTSDDTIMDDVSNQERIIADMDADVDVTLEDVADIAKEVAVDAEIKDDELEPVELQEVVEVVSTAKLMTEVVTAASATITAAAPTLTTAPNAARRR
nr:hypothetical protein [Tanacetum cinerariifolium]